MTVFALNFFFKYVTIQIKIQLGHMMEVLAPYDIERYLENTQKLSLQNNHQGILELINEQQKQHDLPSNILTFFSAEEAFYRNDYKAALQYYLKAKNTPHYEFFCFRASAYASELMNNYLKAIQFAKKSLRIRPDDYPTLAILAKTYTSIDQRDKAQIIKQKLEALKEVAPNEPEPPTQSEETHHFIPVGEQELEELNQIFSNKGSDEQSLFSRESLSHPTKHSYEKDTTPLTKEEQQHESVVLPPGCDLSSHSPKPWEREETLTKRLYVTDDETPPFFLNNKKTPSSSNKLLADYHNLYTKRPTISTNRLYSYKNKKTTDLPPTIQQIVTPTNNSYMIHWKSHGVVINPGYDFLENLHLNGQFVQDIHTVIITESPPECLEEITKLYTLSTQLSAANLGHPITFYVHPTLYETLKHQWSAPQHLYKLTDSWKIHEQIHCTTHCNNDQLCGITVSCQDAHQPRTVTYLIAETTQPTPCDILVLDMERPSSELIDTIAPKITILCNTSDHSSHEQLRHIKNLQQQLKGYSNIIPLSLDLTVNLITCQLQTAGRENSIMMSELCAVATTPSTIELIHKDNILLYT
jgi:tetratricopeptide (TPR) repeat protein